MLIIIIITKMLPQNFPQMQPPPSLKPIHNGINDHIWHSADKIRNKKNLPFPHMKHSNETEMSIKRRNLFDMKIRSMQKSDKIQKSEHNDRYQRSNSQQDGDKGYLHKRSKNYGYVSHLFSVLRRNPSQRSSQQKSSIQNKSHLKQQLQQLSSNPNQMAPGKIRSQKPTPKRISLSSLPKSPSQPSKHQPEVTSKTLKDYSTFIECQQTYSTQINYSYIREVDKIQAFAYINIKQYKVVQSIILCIIDTLNGQHNSSEYLVQEYCGLYFQNEERRKFQVFVNYHVFKGFAIKIKGVYAYVRLAVYFVSKLAQYGLLFREEAKGVALGGCVLVDRLLKCTYEAVSQSLARSNNSVLQTFKSLKTIKQIQKILTQFESTLTQIQSYLSNLQPTLAFTLQLTQILTHMKPFLKQCSFYHLQQYICRAQTIISWKYMRIPPCPYLPEKCKPVQQYTLVMGLNKVLILYNCVSRLLKYRPFMDTFLGRIKGVFQIVVYSQFQKGLTDRIVKQIQKDQTFFSARLYHTHLSFKNGLLTKDLTRVGRPLSSLIFLDTKQYSHLFPQNSLTISQYKPPIIATNSLVRQKSLLNMMNKLLLIGKQYPNDVRKVLKKTADLYQIQEVSSIQESSISIQYQEEGERGIGKTLEKC